MANVSLQVRYSQPMDIAKFEQNYQQRLNSFHEKTLISEDNPPYSISKYYPTPLGTAAYYQLFTLPFESVEILQKTLLSAEMQLIATDAFCISFGGAPVVLVGGDK
jgi:hypothetical protein